jgi:peptidoglycan/xylan/chitin deacetylase (PgdA/CDA1 family)
MLFRRPLMISGANLAFRKDVFLRVGGYKNDSLSSDQLGISTRLTMLGNIVYDKELVAFTSERRVQKPFLFVLVDVIVNVYKIYRHVFYFPINIMKTSMGKLEWKNIGIKSIPPILIIGFLAYGYFVPTASVFGNVYSRGNSTEKVIALTFDDGPNEPYTSQILDILDNHGVRATFFLIGKNVELYPDTANRILSDGHVIGDHTYSHNANHAITNVGCKEINLTQKVIFDTVGVKPHLYRPPHGKKSPWELECIKKDNLIEVTWTDTTYDQLNETLASSFAQKIIEKAKPGEIILLHDGYGTEHNTKDSDKSLTVEALPIIIEGLQKQGYEFVTVPELLGVPAYNN